MSTQPTHEIITKGNKAKENIAHVVVRFESKDKTQPSPQDKIQVPTFLSRSGLSELVNTLLNQESNPKIYEFLIGGQFLITSLKQYLEAKGITGEQEDLVLEYVEAITATAGESMPHPDWVSAIHTQNDCVTSGCYDGIVRLFSLSDVKSNSFSPYATAVGHQGPIKSVKILEIIQNQSNEAKEDKKDSKDSKDSKSNKKQSKLDSKIIISGSKDKTVRVWKHETGVDKCLQVAVCYGHTDSVETVEKLPHSSIKKFASGGWDKKIIIWEMVDDSLLPNAKRRKTQVNVNKKNELPDIVLNPISTLEGHSDAVTSLLCPIPVHGVTPANVLYSASLDRSIKLWDFEVGKEINTWQGNKAITSLSFSLPLNLLLTSHEDRAIRIWDPRIEGKEIIKLVLKGHEGWVSGVSWWNRGTEIDDAEEATEAKENEYSKLLASCSYDGTVRIWDIRSNVPRQTISISNKQKVFCLDWYKGTLLSGCSDGQLRMHSFSTVL